jgi:hypothetical protein
MAQTSEITERLSGGALFKRDRPRPIDRYIDYFGGESASSADERTGETGFVVAERTA